MAIKKHAALKIGDDTDVDVSLTYWPYPAGSGMLPLYPYAVEDAIRENKYKYIDLQCCFLIAAMILEGALLYRFDGRAVTLRPGQILIIPPGHDYEFDSSRYGRYRKLVIEINGYLLESACSMLGLNHIQIRNLNDPDSMCRKIHAIGESLKHASPASMPEKAALGYTMLLELADLDPEQSSDADLFARARQFLEQPDSPTVAGIAEELKISENSLVKLFRTRTGFTPLQYRHHFQISCAQKLLLRREYSIKEIAAQLGFCNQFHFARIFRKECGCSPTAFLQKQ